MARRSRPSPRPRRPRGRGEAEPPPGDAVRLWRHGLAALEELAARPLLLLALVWGVNGILRPYAGLVHDSRLYALLTQNRLEGGALGGDLFLRFGSQDRYSIFSWLAVPVARVLGVEGAFLLGYLVSSLGFWWAAVRLIRALAPDTGAAALGLLVAAAAPLPFGGLGVFHVHEPFLTPRLPASALVLLGIERMIAGRHAAVTALLAAAAVLHPAMALGGVMAWMAWAGVALWTTRSGRLIVGAGALAGVATVATPPLGTRVFGTMDAEWLGIVRWVTPATMPLEWRLIDWLDTALCLAVLLGAAALLRGERPLTARLLAIAAGIGSTGLALTLVAAAMPYALLLQAQPYRVLWIGEALQWPLALVIVVRLWRMGGLARRGLATTLVVCAGLTRATPGDVGVVLLLPLAIAVLWGLGLFPASTRRRVAALVTGAVLGIVALTVLKLRFLVAAGRVLWADLTPVEHVSNAVELVGPPVWVAAVFVVVARLAVGPRSRRALATAAALLGAVASLAVLVPGPRPEATALPLIREHRPAAASAPIVYANWARPDQLWLGLRATIYFHPVQLAGAVFGRATALEGRRREALVHPFEASRYAEGRLLVAEASGLRRLGITIPLAAPADLHRLCRDELDLAVLRERFPGLYAATDGLLYLYDCRRLRASSPSAPSSPR